MGLFGVAVMYQLLKQSIHTYAYPLLVYSALAMLGGCASEGTPKNTVSTVAPPAYPNQTESSQATTPIQPRPLPAIVAPAPQANLRTANQLLQQGRKVEAAQAYYQVALTYASPQRERVLLQAAEITASLGNSALTNQYLGQTNSQYITGESLERLRYIKALLALQTNNPAGALNLLPDESTVRSSPALAEKVRHVRVKAMTLTGNNQSTQTTPPRPQLAPSANNNEPVIPTSTDYIAVLLPRSGSLSVPANEILQGIQIAQAQTGSDTRIKLYDTSTGVLNQYRTAVAEGADLIIGPLDKENVLELLRSPQELTKPILALNYLDNNARTPRVLYQFGLSPEDEAIQIAQTALQRGLNQAVVMAPDSAWGNRLAQAFSRTYQAGGGQVIGKSSYSTNPQSYLGEIQRNIVNSNAQMVFLAASPTQARLIRPLLQAQVGLMPVYATSHIFSGRLEPNKDTDLDGIIYTEIPWVLENTRTGTLNSNQYPRLYALGIDAFLVAKNLQNLVYGNQALRGKTGQVSMRDQKVQRSLGLATFINGEPAPLE
jgi:hypothetical protein